MKKQLRAFTLVEIMIVVLIIGILMGIALPQFLNARSRSWHRSCLSNLRAMDNAKEVWAMEMRQAPGTAVVESDLVPDFIRGTALPDCPANGTYDLTTVGNPPTCDFTDGVRAHLLP